MTDDNTDTTDDGTHHVDVDLSTDDADAGETATTADEVPTPDEDESLKARGKETAETYLQDADGQTTREKAGNALGDLRETVQQTEQQLQAVNQSKQEKESRREKLADTKDRVEQQSPNAQILQTLGGGITLEVPPETRPETTASQDDVEVEVVDEDHYTREDLVTDIEETREQLRDQLDTLESRKQQLDDSMEVLRIAFERIQDYREMASTVGDDNPATTPGGRPEHGQTQPQNRDSSHPL